MALTFDFAQTPPPDRYKLLTGLVVPRPIALVTTRSAAGVVNAAPFSFFNVFAQEPALIVLGMDTKPSGEPKDTLRNVRDTRVFCVNLVDEAFAEAMNACATDFPPDMSETDSLGLSLSPGIVVPVPWLSEAPAALECRHVMTLNFGATRDLVIGEVVALHARDGVVDPKNLRTNYEVYRPVGRLGGTMYSRQGDTFSMEREPYAAWLARTGGVRP